MNKEKELNKQEQLNYVLRTLESKMQNGGWELRRTIIRGHEAFVVGFTNILTSDFLPLSVLVNEAVYNELLNTDNQGNRIDLDE